MRVFQLWGWPGALVGGLCVVAEVVWFSEMVQLIGARRRSAEAKLVLVRGFCALRGWAKAI